MASTSDLECDHAMMHSTQAFCPSCFASRNKIEALRERAKYDRCECGHLRREHPIAVCSLAGCSCGAFVTEKPKPPPLRFMIHAQARSTVLMLDQVDGRELFSINGHVLEDARAVRIEKDGDRICVSFQLETEPVAKAPAPNEIGCPCGCWRGAKCVCAKKNEGKRCGPGGGCRDDSYR